MTTEKVIRDVPKVLLHDHLDGGLRPQTIIELAKEQGYDKLPTEDPGELAEWFHRGANKGNLVEYYVPHGIALHYEGGSEDSPVLFFAHFLSDIKDFSED